MLWSFGFSWSIWGIVDGVPLKRPTGDFPEAVNSHRLFLGLDRSMCKLAVGSLVEKIAKKDRGCFFIVDLLTTLICSHLNNYILFYFMVYQQKF